MRGLAFIPARGLIAIFLTVVGLVLLLSFKTPDLPTDSAGGGGRLGAVVQPSATATVGAIGGPPRASGTPPPRSGGGNAPQVTAGATVVPTAPPASPRPTATPGGNATLIGPAVETPYGSVQVEAKLSGGRIVDIVAMELPSDRRLSQQISQYVEPILHDEALQAQSAQIDGISGATWTSGAYAKSLQGALDQRHG